MEDFQIFYEKKMIRFIEGINPENKYYINSMNKAKTFFECFLNNKPLPMNIDINSLPPLNNRYITPKFLIALCNESISWDNKKSTFEKFLSSSITRFNQKAIANNLVSALGIIFKQLELFLNQLDSLGAQNHNDTEKNKIQSMFRFTFPSEAHDTASSFNSSVISSRAPSLKFSAIE